MTPAEIRARIAAAREWHKVTQFGRIARLLEILDSGAVFIAVPDGEPCTAEDAHPNCNFVLYNGDLCMPEYHIWSWVAYDGSMPDIHIDTIVQPVRLLTLAELERLSATEF